MGSSYLAIIWLHWLGDFVFQTDKMAINKSGSWKWLGAHVSTYALFLLPYGVGFALINAVMHALTDAITARVTKLLWAKGDRHNFFVVIGLDQAIHLTTLFYTFEAMK